MSRPVRVPCAVLAAIALAVLASACGTERIAIPASDSAHTGAVLFSQRCSGCHTLAYAATHGSATNARTAQMNNGPNFDVRCERPVTRVLYAIENGGFSGAIMPQNIVVGQDAREVAQFVSKYAGGQAPALVGQTPCNAESAGALPAPGQSATTAAKSAGSGVQEGVGKNLAPGGSTATNPATVTKGGAAKAHRGGRSTGKRPPQRRAKRKHARPRTMRKHARR